MPPIQDRDREEVEDSEVDIEEDDEPEHPAKTDFGHGMHGVHDPDGPAQVAHLDIGIGMKEPVQGSADHGSHLGDHLHRILPDHDSFEGELETHDWGHQLSQPML